MPHRVQMSHTQCVGNIDVDVVILVELPVPDLIVNALELELITNVLL